MAQAVDVVLPGDPGSPRRARRRLEPLREALNETRFGDLRLLVSELVAEAAGAFGGAPSEAISVHAEADRGRILVSVQEGSKSFPTSSSVPEPATPGWSLYLVQRVSDDWGLRRAGDGVTVWFELTARPRPSPGLASERVAS
jgi:Histidine kinase-like ATPase domain